MYMNKCINCNKNIPNRNKYCSLKCQKEFEYKSYIDNWKKRYRARNKRLISNIYAYKKISVREI